MQRMFMLSASVATMIWAANAVAASPKLKGVYSFDGSATCIVSDTGFDPVTLRPLVPDAFLHSFSVEGVRFFNGDGSGTVKGSAMSVNFGSMRTSASSSDFTFSFTYTVNDDQTWTSDMVPGSFMGTITSGVRSGQSYTIDKLPTFKGHISQNAMTLTAATLTPTIETVVYSGPPTATEYRICNRARTFTYVEQQP